MVSHVILLFRLYGLCVCAYKPGRKNKSKRERERTKQQQKQKIEDFFFLFLPFSFSPPAENIWFTFTDGSAIAECNNSTHSIIKMERKKEDKELWHHKKLVDWLRNFFFPSGEIVAPASSDQVTHTDIQTLMKKRGKGKKNVLYYDHFVTICSHLRHPKKTSSHTKQTVCESSVSLSLPHR